MVSFELYNGGCKSYHVLCPYAKLDLSLIFKRCAQIRINLPIVLLHSSSCDRKEALAFLLEKSISQTHETNGLL